MADNDLVWRGAGPVRRPMKTTRQKCDCRRRVAELFGWKLATGRNLPYSAGYILAVEDAGGWVDLETGFIFLAGGTALHWAPTAKAREAAHGR